MSGREQYDGQNAYRERLLLEYLAVAVGSETCLLCVCDMDGNGAIVASDALALLRLAVGSEAPLACEPCP